MAQCYNFTIVMNRKLSIKVPATSANMGPGFDCLGIALDIWNKVSVMDSDDSESRVLVIGNGESELSYGTDNLVFQGFSRLFNVIGRQIPNVIIECENKIPLSRGMGSSSAALVGGLYAANTYAERPLNDSELLKLAADMEGHPDNVSPALLGGMQIGIYDDGALVTAGVPIPENLSAVLFVPNVPMPTKEARDILKSHVDRSDAVYNIGRAAMMVQAMITGRLDYLRYATQDKLHQPDRQKVFFPMNNIIRAAMACGALGAFLSGSGSTILAFCTERQYTIGYEMADAGVKSGLDGEVIITRPTYLGAHIVD